MNFMVSCAETAWPHEAKEHNLFVILEPALLCTIKPLARSKAHMSLTQTTSREADPTSGI